MNNEEKNNLYHNILDLIRDSGVSDRDKALNVLSFIESKIKEKEIEMEEQREALADGAPNLPPAKFGKTFRRSE